MDDALFRARARERLGPLDDEATDRAIRIALRVLGQACSPRLVAVIAEQLPPSASAELRAVSRHDPADAPRLMSRVAQIERVPLSMAREHVTSVLVIVGACLDGEAHQLITAELSPDVAALLQPPHEHGAEHAPSEPSAARHTLSEGRPGSEHSIASAHHPVAHVDSVDGAAHVDERLSQARGLRQEQAHHTLAEGRSRRA